MNHWQYLDEVAAIIIIIGCLVLIGLGIDGEVKVALGMAAVWAFKGGNDIRSRVKGEQNG